MTRFIKHVKLLALLLQKGRVRAHGVDFVKRRREGLGSLINFVPTQRIMPGGPERAIVKSPWATGLLAQAAF